MFSLHPASVFDPPSLLQAFLSSPVKLLLRCIHKFCDVLRSSQSSGTPSISVVCISDIHSKKVCVPDGDLLIIAGDLTNDGTPRDIQAQIDWLDSLPHRHKIAIAGNHDYWLDPRARSHLKGVDLSPGYVDWKSIKYLQHSQTTLRFLENGNRELIIYGAPQIPACGPEYFAFQYPRLQDAWSDTIPNDIDILVTHTPPKYHLDLPVALGCEHLLKEIWRVRPTLHVFGHVHAGRGSETVHWDEAQKAYEAAAARPDGLVRSTLDPVLWFNVIKVVVYGFAGFVWTQIWGGRSQSTRLVNASLMYNNTGRLANSAQVVRI